MRTELKIGDLVLLKWTKVNNSDPIYDPKPYRVVAKTGSMITVERRGKRCTRNSSFIKKFLSPGSVNQQNRLPSPRNESNQGLIWYEGDLIMESSEGGQEINIELESVDKPIKDGDQVVVRKMVRKSQLIKYHILVETFFQELNIICSAIKQKFNLLCCFQYYI